MTVIFIYNADMPGWIQQIGKSHCDQIADKKNAREKGAYFIPLLGETQSILEEKVWR